MKKITFIACAALIAGLLVSCNSEAGVKDYNEVTTTSTYNSYVVKGTIATTIENSSKDFNAKDEQIDGSSSSITTTERIVSTPAYVSFGTNENFDGNYASYKIVYDSSTGFSSSVKNSETYWDLVAEEEKKVTDADIKAYNDAHKEADDPTVDIDGDNLYVYVIDDVLYVIKNGERFEVTADAEKIAEGESFSLSVTLVSEPTEDNNDDSTNYSTTYFDSDGKQWSREEKSYKITTKYDLTFTAK